MEKLSLQKIKDLKKLHLKKYRDAQKRLYIEGETLIKDLIKHFPHLIEELIIENNKTLEFEQLEIPLFIAAQNQLEKLTSLKTPKKVNAVVHFPSNQPWEKGQKALLIDQIQDPGNLGTIIRAADWFGIKHLICAPNTVDYLNPKVIHASMISSFRVNVSYQNLELFIKDHLDNTFGAFMDGTDFQKINPDDIDFVLLGNEGTGISPALEAVIKNRIGISRKGSGESLNVAVAAGILLQHMTK